MLGSPEQGQQAYTKIRHRKANLIKGVLSFVLCLLAVSCAVPLYKEAKVEPKKPLPPPKLPREPGSLWTVDSKWNDLYSFTAGRDLGDILFVKPSPQLTLMVARKAGKATEKVPNNEVKRTQKEPEAELIPVTIREVLPRGVYVVESAPTLNLPEIKDAFSFKGNVRERDISQDDIVNSESLYNFTVALASPDLSARRRVDSLFESENKPENKAEETPLKKEEEKIQESTEETKEDK